MSEHPVSFEEAKERRQQRSFVIVEPETLSLSKRIVRLLTDDRDHFVNGIAYAPPNHPSPIRYIGSAGGYSASIDLGMYEDAAEQLREYREREDLGAPEIEV